MFDQTRLPWVWRISAALLAFLIPVYAASAASEKVLYTFPSAQFPAATGLVVGPHAGLYGATTDSVYELTQNAKKDWVVTPIYTFTGSAAEDGYDQINSLVYYGGSLYGTSRGGGIDCPQQKYRGCGFVFQLIPSTTAPTKWTEKTIYRFAGKTDGVLPSGITVSDTGIIYGTTAAGGGVSGCGSDNSIQNGCGTVFRLEQVKGKWTEAVLHRFQGGTDLIQPAAAPSLDAMGNIYFSAPQGGSSGTNAISAKASPDESCDGYGGYGILVAAAKPEYYELYVDTCESLGPEYAEAVLLLLLNGESDNNTVKSTSSPDVVAGTIEKAADQVIATSVGGGLVKKCAEAENNGCGEVDLLTKPKSGTGRWALKMLHEFSGPDGAGPYGSLLKVGNTIYGVTEGDPDVYACSTSPTLGGCGTIFALTKSSAGWGWGGSIYRFKGGADGATPLGQLTLYHGQIFGVTAAGGKNTQCNGCGTIFLLTP